MQFLRDFLSNYVFWSAVTGWISAQIIKTIIDIIYKKKLKLSMIFFSTGGMPSSHSSTVVALCTSSALSAGLDSAVFAVTAVLAIVVMIDASGVRYETGKQAKILNKITKELFSGDAEAVNTGLKELVGHTPFQVVMGAILGFVVAFVMAFIMGIF